MTGPAAQFYRGADRRQSRAHRRGVRRIEVLALVGGLVLGGVVLPLALMTLPRASALQIQSALRNVWSAVFLCGGVLQLVRWRVTGRTQIGLRGAAATALGLLTAPTAAVAPMLHWPATEVALAPASRIVAVVACLSLLNRAAASVAVDTRVKPVQALAVTVASGWGVIALVVLLAGHQRRFVGLSDADWFGIECALAVGWIHTGVVVTRRALVRRDPSIVWMAVATSLMAVAEIFRGVAFVGRPELQYFATGIQLVVSGLVLLNAATDLRVLISAQSSRMYVLSGTVKETTLVLAADEQAAASHRHDARSALASLRAATNVLDRYDAALDTEARARLLSLFSDELRRLEWLTERRPPSPLQALRLDDVLGQGLPEAATESPAGLGQ